MYLPTVWNCGRWEQCFCYKNYCWRYNIWKVDIDTQTDLQGSLEQLKLEEGMEGVQMLEADDEIQNALPDPQPKHIHIVVECPVSGQFIISSLWLRVSSAYLFYV